MKKENEEQKEKDFLFNMDSTSEQITPKKDHVIKQNKFFYELKQGVPAYVHKSFLEALKTEKVI